MRAKLKVTQVKEYPDSEVLTFQAVYKDKYDLDGLDEDNTFSKFTPNANLTMTIQNPMLLNKFETGQTYYVDFTRCQ